MRGRIKGVAAFTAFVTEGPLTGPAGGGFGLVHDPGGETTMLDCFFEAPTNRLGEMEELVIDFGDSWMWCSTSWLMRGCPRKVR